MPSVLLRHITIDYIPDTDRVAVDLAFGLVVGSRVLAHEKEIRLHVLQSSVLVVVEFCLCDRSQSHVFSFFPLSSVRMFGVGYRPGFRAEK